MSVFEYVLRVPIGNSKFPLYKFKHGAIVEVEPAFSVGSGRVAVLEQQMFGYSFRQINGCG